MSMNSLGFTGNGPDDHCRDPHGNPYRNENFYANLAICALSAAAALYRKGLEAVI